MPEQFETIRERLQRQLQANGMFPQDAEEVMATLIAQGEDGVPGMAYRWDDSPEGYPPMFLAVLWVPVSAAALAWIDANCPKAWYRPMFAPEECPAGGGDDA